MDIPFSRLVHWYIGQCNGIWEHEHFGFLIETMDNPALKLVVDLNGTTFENVKFKTVERGLESDDAWLTCEKTSDNRFEGYCSPNLIGELIGEFVAWTEEVSSDK